MTNKKVLPYVVYKGEKYVRGKGMMKYQGANKKWADEFYNGKEKTLKQIIYGTKI